MRPRDAVWRGVPLLAIAGAVAGGQSWSLANYLLSGGLAPPFLEGARWWGFVLEVTPMAVAALGASRLWDASRDRSQRVVGCAVLLASQLLALMPLAWLLASVSLGIPLVRPLRWYVAAQLALPVVTFSACGLLFIVGLRERRSDDPQDAGPA